MAAIFSSTPATNDADQRVSVSELRAASPLPGIGNLRRLRVEDVAIPRAEITAVPVDIDKDTLVETFRDSGNTRLPVYDGTLDLPLGLIHLKDFALRNGFNGGRDADLDLRALVRPLLYAPPSMPIGVLLQKMQTDRMHMALVIDEYGGVDGLVTIEDLIEQVIGEIEDEHDVEEAVHWTEERPGVYLALARTPLEDFEQAIGVQLVTAEDGEEVDTLGGLLFMEIGRVPVRGEVLTLDSGVQFEVVDADPRRIKRLRVRMPGAAITAAKRAKPASQTVPPTPMSPAASSGDAQAGAGHVNAGHVNVGHTNSSQGIAGHGPSGTGQTGSGTSAHGTPMPTGSAQPAPTQSSATPARPAKTAREAVAERSDG